MCLDLLVKHFDELGGGSIDFIFPEVKMGENVDLKIELENIINKGRMFCAELKDKRSRLFDHGTLVRAELS